MSIIDDHIQVSVEATDVGGVVVRKRATGPESGRRLAREAALLDAARHPGVVVIVDRSADGAGALDLAWAGPHSLASRPRLPIDEVAGLATSLATTVADLHDLGIVHGRIVPDHVLVGGDGRPILCGIAEGRMPGVDGGSDADRRDDVAAIGALVVWLVGDDSEIEPIPEHRWWRPRRWDGYHRRALLNLADHASDPDPDHRPSARTLADAITKAVPSARLPADRTSVPPGLAPSRGSGRATPADRRVPEVGDRGPRTPQVISTDRPRPTVGPVERDAGEPSPIGPPPTRLDHRAPATTGSDPAIQLAERSEPDRGTPPSAEDRSGASAADRRSNRTERPPSSRPTSPTGTCPPTSADEPTDLQPIINRAPTTTTEPNDADPSLQAHTAPLVPITDQPTSAPEPRDRLGHAGRSGGRSPTVDGRTAEGGTRHPGTVPPRSLVEIGAATAGETDGLPLRPNGGPVPVPPRTATEAALDPGSCEVAGHTGRSGSLPDAPTELALGRPEPTDAARTGRPGVDSRHATDATPDVSSRRARPARRRWALGGVAAGLLLLSVVAVGTLADQGEDRGHGDRPSAAARSATATSSSGAAESACPTVVGPRADTDGDGCAELVVVDGRRVRVGERSFLVGTSGDRVAVGDWDCDGTATPAVLRSSTGAIYTFERWPDAASQPAATLVASVDAATDVHARPGPSPGCPVLVVDRKDQPARVLDLGARR